MSMKISGATGITFPDDTVQDTAALVPKGAIILWSGAANAIPFGYYLCNGQNGTPNLMDKFIVGAGNAYAVNATGGSKDAIVVSHTHTASSTTNISDPGHIHSMTAWGNAGTNSGTNSWPSTAVSTSFNTNSATTGITAGTTTTVNAAGADGTNANLPPYFAICYIMKG